MGADTVSISLTLACNAGGTGACACWVGAHSRGACVAGSGDRFDGDIKPRHFAPPRPGDNNVHNSLVFGSVELGNVPLVVDKGTRSPQGANESPLGGLVGPVPHGTCIARGSVLELVIEGLGTAAFGSSQRARGGVC